MSAAAFLKPGKFYPVYISDPAERVRIAEAVVERVAVERLTFEQGMGRLRFFGLNADDAALGRAVEAMRLRDEVLGCEAQVERYTDVSPIEGTHRAAARFVDDQADIIDLAVEEMTK